STGEEVDAAGVGDHADPLLHTVGEDFAHERHEVTGVALRRIPRPLLLQDRHRDLGQVVQHEVVDRPAPYLVDRRIQAVAPEALPGSDAYRSVGAHRAPALVSVGGRTAAEKIRGGTEAGN